MYALGLGVARLAQDGNSCLCITALRVLLTMGEPTSTDLLPLEEEHIETGGEGVYVDMFVSLTEYLRRAIRSVCRVESDAYVFLSSSCAAAAICGIR